MKRGTAYHQDVEFKKDGIVYFADVKVEWSESQPVHTSWDGSPGTDGHQSFEFEVEHMTRDNPDDFKVDIVPKSEWYQFEGDIYQALYNMPWDKLTEK